MLSKHIKDNANKNLLTDTFTFENFQKYNGLYVDKTEYLYRLITSGKRLFFFSRPRRFGKSLTLSTLKAIVENYISFLPIYIIRYFQHLRNQCRIDFLNAWCNTSKQK